jgi:hypothetical protein
VSALPLAFANPAVLAALALLPAIWWLLRLTPPLPQREPFPPFEILARLVRRREWPARSPWWLTLLRLLLAALVILAMAGPVFNPQKASLAGSGPLLVVVDDGWAAAPDWDRRRSELRRLVEEAGAADRTVLLLAAAGDSLPPQPLEAQAALARIEAMAARPLPSDRAAAATLIREAVRRHAPDESHYLSDGIASPADGEFLDALGGAGTPVIRMPEISTLVAIAGIRNDPDALTGTLVRAGGASAGFVVEAVDAQGRPVARREISFAAGEREKEFRFDEPVELRNQVLRVSVAGARTAGAVQLLDDSFRRRVVGLLSGESADQAQPLLSPLHYITRALSPYADLRRGEGGDVAGEVGSLLSAGVSAMVLADIGRLPKAAESRLAEWISGGGMLIRFAGPRMAASADELLPVRLRGGERNLGGAMSWETPKAVAPFEEKSPFFGIDAPRSVTVGRQVLAAREPGLEEKTWAVLEDGTPLVTAARRGAGWIVLFHTSSDASWSNLAISGTFVDMLRRVVGQARLKSPAAGAYAEASLPPLAVMDGEGRLGPPGLDARPLKLAVGASLRASAGNPPGLYGETDGFVALNLFAEGDRLAPFDHGAAAGSTRVEPYAETSAIRLRPFLLAAAALLLLADCAIVLWMAGALRRPARIPAAVAGVALLLAAAPPSADPALAQDDAFSAALVTRLAYVVTGDSEVDEISRAGLSGLSRFIAARTALEPGEPAGVDPSADELAFYPLLYWPVLAQGPLPDAAALARIDAFMKRGGTILFDTRDQASGALGGTASSPEAQRLQAILSSLDIPPLEPVSAEHVLTKSFFLLTTFPGRYAGGDLWVEALPPADPDAPARPARAGDGVSSILITSNDFAGAWAADDAGQPMFATVPSDPAQRELSYRVGVNIAMYVLTGNYKADQVHVPALLERLGE